MPIYEYYCPTCRNRFEQRRPMSMATAAATCDHGHQAARTISTFAAPRNDGFAEFEPSASGGCCGGGACGCGASSN